MDLQELQIKLNDFVTNYDTYVDEFIKTIEPDLIDTNTAQLDKSIDSTGKKLPAYANPEYQEVLEGLRAAIETEETIIGRIKEGQANIEIWRTQQANKRRNDGSHN